MTVQAGGDRLLPAQNRSTRLRELGADLHAVWSGEPRDAGLWMTRPSILRRVAAEAALRIDAGVDRIVAFGPGARVLGAAVSLSTGLPYCADEGGGVFGDHHPGEIIALVSV
ncbi:MAG: hypothetical protein WA971_10385, partial [Microbacterium sp.]